MFKRQHYIDWLRVLAVLLLFPFHVSRVFNAGEPFYVKAAVQSVPLGYVLAFIDVWHMPLLFLLAGMSSGFALRKRSGGQYVVERVKRLLIPFIFGFLVLIPPQTWYGARFNSGYTGSLLSYVTSGDFLVWNIHDGGDYYGGFGIGHLWFILWLFVISLVALPLLLWGRTERGAAAWGRFSRLLSRPTWWIIGALIILVGEALPDPVGKNPFFYLAFFLLGYFAIADPSFVEAAERHRWPALAIGVVISVLWVATAPLRDSLPDPSWPLVGIVIVGDLGRWVMMIGLLGLGRRYLDKPSRTLSYLAEGSYPIYILHQTVIVILAFYVVLIPAAWPLQWVMLFAPAVLGTFAIYEGVRRVSVLRFLFGMRPKVRAGGAAEPSMTVDSVPPVDGT